MRTALPFGLHPLDRCLVASHVFVFLLYMCCVASYDRHQQELEEKLDEKTAALIHLQRVTMEHNAASPVKNNELEQALGAWGRGNGRRTRGRGGDGARSRGGGDGSGSGPEDGADSVPPALLITTKQFRPYRKAQTVFSGSGVEPQTTDRCDRRRCPCLARTALCLTLGLLVSQQRRRDAAVCGGEDAGADQAGDCSGGRAAAPREGAGGGPG